MATRPRQTFEGHRQLRQSIGSGVLHESDCEDDHASRLGQPSPDGSLEARERQVLLVCFPHHLLSRVPGHLTRLTQWQLRRTVGPGLQDAEALLIAVQQFAVREIHDDHSVLSENFAFAQGGNGGRTRVT